MAVCKEARRGEGGKARVATGWQGWVGGHGWAEDGWMDERRARDNFFFRVYAAAVGNHNLTGEVYAGVGWCCFL